MSIERNQFTRAALLAAIALLGAAVTLVACSTRVDRSAGPGEEPEAVASNDHATGRAPATPRTTRVEGDVEAARKRGDFDLRSSALPRALGAPSHFAPRHPPTHGDHYAEIREEGFLSPIRQPLSTFSVDVDTASYSNVRRHLKEGVLPPSDAVRIEEFLNYFSYDYPAAEDEAPIALHTERARAPWAPDHQLVMVGLKGVELEARELPPRNLTFLLDVSGSMSSADRLPLVVRAMKGLTKTLRPEDHVSIVVYSGASGLVLEPTPGDERNTIVDALENLHAGGSTNGGDGIRLAYETARRHFDPDGINRVILATDGDFNVGTTGRDELLRLIEKERESGVFLTVLGVGRGNLADATIEMLADHGNGNYAYLDTIGEARKVLIRESGGTLVTVAKDVKIQIEFNPAQVAGYRLIGYENRRLQDRDFNDDGKDAGEVGAGHSVTALYEIFPHGVDRPVVDPLRYQRPAPEDSRFEDADELLTVKVRYKRPDEQESRLLVRHVTGEPTAIEEASDDLRFAAAVAAFGMRLRNSAYAGDASFDLAAGLARRAIGRDPHGDRAEFLYLVSEARELTEGMGS